LKIQPGETQVRNYLRAQLNRYQQPSCDTLLDAQLNELLALAGSSAERPASFKIPSEADLQKSREEDTTIDSILGDLKGGGERAKNTWLAVCGFEYTGLGGKLFETTEADNSIILKVFSAAKQEDIEAATTPNLELKIEGQPEAKRLKKDSLFLFKGTFASYSPEPFMVRMDKAMVNAEHIPEEEKLPAKAPAKKAPAKRPPTKRPPAKPAGL
jgi:hypothetical protein